MPIKIFYGKIPAHRPRGLSPQDEVAIKRRHVIGGEKLSALAKEYGYSVPGIRLIVKRTPLADLTPTPAPKPETAETKEQAA